jgi:hypothetical protein
MSHAINHPGQVCQPDLAMKRRLTKPHRQIKGGTTSTAVRVFHRAQVLEASLPAPSALAVSPTTSRDASHALSGTRCHLPTFGGTKTAESSVPTASPSATNGRDLAGAWQTTTTQLTCVPGVETRATEPKLALEARRLKALTPYHPRAWREALEEFDLLHRYPHILDCLKTSFSGGIPTITHTYIPPNNISITVHAEALQTIISK